MYTFTILPHRINIRGDYVPELYGEQDLEEIPMPLPVPSGLVVPTQEEAEAAGMHAAKEGFGSDDTLFMSADAVKVSIVETSTLQEVNSIMVPRGALICPKCGNMYAGGTPSLVFHVVEHAGESTTGTILFDRKTQRLVNAGLSTISKLQCSRCLHTDEAERFMSCPDTGGASLKIRYVGLRGEL